MMVGKLNTSTLISLRSFFCSSKAELKADTFPSNLVASWRNSSGFSSQFCNFWLRLWSWGSPTDWKYRRLTFFSEQVCLHTGQFFFFPFVQYSNHCCILKCQKHTNYIITTSWLSFNSEKLDYSICVCILFFKIATMIKKKIGEHIWHT